MSKAIEIIAAERNRQIKEVGYSTAMDDKQTCGDLSDAAAIYAMSPYYRNLPLNEDGTIFEFIWPWERKYYKPAQYKDYKNVYEPETEVDIKLRIKELAKSGALIAAEIDRLLRILSKKSQE